ncbi:MAG TPA: efflux RND transporter periplasmic adaptor subunit [Bacteroidales bacterium]|nr:efflux RND transporter periplasmic adaptor subunit [Bacteroidales bacterium]
MKRYFLLLTLLSVILVSCKNNGNKTDSETLADDTTIYRVKTLLLEKQNIAQKIEYTASLLPYEEIHYAPASPGRIEEINVEVGSRVAKGSVIARMDRTNYNNANEQLQSARSNYLRMDTLHKLNSISEAQWEAAKTQYEVAKTNVDFLAKNTMLVSPINGIVTGKYFESGELYSGVPNTAAGKAAIVTLMQINPLKAKINISERYYPLLKQGMKASVAVDIFPDKSVEGQIFRIYPTVSSDTRTFPVELTIPNGDEKLRPGMFARVSLDLGETSAMVVPSTAVIKQQGTNNHFVFIAGAGTIAHKKEVEIGARFDDKLEIISTSLKEGDQIIIAGQNKLLDGSKITIIK